MGTDLSPRLIEKDIGSETEFRVALPLLLPSDQP